MTLTRIRDILLDGCKEELTGSPDSSEHQNTYYPFWKGTIYYRK